MSDKTRGHATGREAVEGAGARGRSEKISVLVIEDDYYARRAMTMLMEANDIEILGVCETPQQGYVIARRDHPRVALVDMSLQGDRRGGVEVIRQLRAISPGTACCGITSTDLRGVLFADVFFAGAQGYSRKGDPTNGDLREVTRRLAHGEWVVDAELAKRYLARGAQVDQWRSDSPESEEPRLTQRELDCLALVAQQLPTKEIASRLFITTNTVKTHIRHIVSKLRVQNRDQAVLFAVLKGYIANSGEPDGGAD